MSPPRYGSALVGGLLAAWRGITHRVLHPISGGIVLTAAGVELVEWLHTAAEHLARLMEAATGAAAG